MSIRRCIKNHVRHCPTKRYSHYIWRNLKIFCMSEGKQSKLKRKLRIAVFVENSYEQLFTFGLTPLNVVIVVGTLAILLVLGTLTLIAATDLKEYIPGYPTGEERRAIVENYQRTMELSDEIVKRDIMISNLRAVLDGTAPIEACDYDSIVRRSERQIELSNHISDADSLFRLEVEAEDKFSIDKQRVGASYDTSLEMMFFYPPIKGIVVSKFDEAEEHFGTDIASAEGEPVASVLDGTIILAEWTVETGYVIEIQHENQLISIYKHNGKLFKRAGSRVKAGEAIAFSGNSGELTTGPHLHFELWYAGVALDPENYISFE